MSRVSGPGGKSELFAVPTGVRQGCPLSPTLSNFVVDWILRNVLSGALDVQLSSTFDLTDLAYVTGIALFGDSFAAVQEAVNKAQRSAAVVCLRIKASIFTFERISRANSWNNEKIAAQE